jgi:thrombospondin type 3 repeat protein
MRRGVLVCLVALLALLAATGPAAAHPEPNDIDGDNVVNAADNCMANFNPDQLDVDGDGVGNACDTDYDPDGDGFFNPPNGTPLDNCPDVANPDQAPSAVDPTIGDACDDDADLDGIFDVRDNCPRAANPFQGNIDRDDLGDVCDEDDDGDDPDVAADLRDFADNCPTVYNPDQQDLDGDGLGTLCDAVDTPPAAGAANPSAPSIGGSPAPAPGAAADGRAPRLTVRVGALQRFAAIAAGLVVRVRCDEACAVTSELVLDPARARALGLSRSRVVASGSAQVAAAATTYAFVRFTPAARRALFRRAGVVATLRTIAVDAAGNRRTSARRVALRR